MAHLKRQKVPKNWPIERKGTKYVVRPVEGLSNGVPVLIALRDMLKLAQNRREAKIAINLKRVELNSKAVKDDKKLIFLFDVLRIVPSDEYYRLGLGDTGKFKFEKIDKKDASKKVLKIAGKKIVKGRKTQINFQDGTNIISDIKCRTNDSILFDLKAKKPLKVLPLKEGANVLVFAGKHAGKKGVIEKLEQERKMVRIKMNGKKINTLIKQIIVLE